MPDATTTAKDIKKAAISYAEYGMPVIPICPPDHKGMNNTHREKCKCAGKSPIISGWQKHTYTSEENVNKWFNKNPHLNIGMPLGQVCGIVGIDIDGHENMDVLHDISDGVLPNTWEFTTGNGYRILYQIPPNLKTKKYVVELEEGEVAIMCDGQQTVLPPSVHPSGKKYIWTISHSPEDIPIAEAPEWLIERIAQRDDEDNSPVLDELDEDNDDDNKVTEKDWTKTVNEGNRNNHLTRLAGSLVARGTLPKEAITDFLQTWNQKHCDPPIPRTDIERMVEGLMISEEMDNAKRSRETASGNKREFRPTNIVKTFLRIEKRQGIKWRYSSNDGSFYKTDIEEGPWNRTDKDEVMKSFREFIIDPNKGGDPQWDKSHYVREMYDAAKSYLLNSKGDVVFDMGERLNSGDYDVLKYIHVGNGLLEWKKAKLHPWDPQFYTTIQIPIEWQGLDTECPAWEDTLEEWLPDEGTRKFIQEYIGLSLVPDTRYRTAVFLYGEGSNGKGLFLDTVSKLFGDSLTAIPLNRLTNKFETGNLQNILINICGDIDTQYMKETGTLKAIIGGDILRGERKFGKSYDFRPVARLLFSANRLPQVADKTHAWYSRWRFVKFPNIFKVNPAFKINFMRNVDEELPGILAWAVKGLMRLEANNGFTVGEAMKVSASEYKQTNDSVIFFLAQCCENVSHTGRDTTTFQRALWRTYCEWCEQEGLKNVGMREFGKRIDTTEFERGRRSIGGKGGMCVLGVKLQDGWKSAYDEYERLQRV